MNLVIILFLYIMCYSSNLRYRKYIRSLVCSTNIARCLLSEYFVVTQGHYFFLDR